MTMQQPVRGTDPGMSMPPLLVRANAAARMLGISRSTLYARVNAGKCPPPIRWDGTTVWRVADLRALVEAMAPAPTITLN